MSTRALIPWLAALAAVAPATAQELAPERQILWQRTLDDALALARARGRPILVAVNMDGESASERIVRERYRDPAFVAHTRAFACLAASSFRHAPRDSGERGRRVPCPRLGEVTCGEHMALEGLLFDRFLGGERIAPRHALVQLDGTKTFDLFLLFDLRELDRELAEAAAAANGPCELEAPLEPHAAWETLAAARSQRGRAALEEKILQSDPGELERGLEAIESAGDRGSIGALRAILARAPERARRVAAAAWELSCPAEAALALRERASAGGWSLASGEGAAGRGWGLGPEADLLAALGVVLPAVESMPRLPGLIDDPRREHRLGRLVLLACALLAPERDRQLALEGLERCLEPADFEGVADVVAGFAEDIEAREASALSAARRGAASEEARAGAAEPLPEAAVLEQRLVELDERAAREGRTADLELEIGRAALLLARARIERGGRDVDLLLEDASRALERAAAARPDDVSLALDRARAAYYQSRFEEQERLSLEALAALQRLSKDAPGAGEGRAEALRWLGDAEARLAAARFGGDPAAEALGIGRGARALLEVAAGPEAGESDWVSLVSFASILSLRGAQIAWGLAALERYPESEALRTQVANALWSAGALDELAHAYGALERGNPRSGACAWYSGYAHVLRAEALRRAERPDESIQAYREAQAAFERALALRPELRESCDHYRALAALGRGFAHLLADRRSQAAEELARGLAIRPAIADVRDGLDREALDLLDGALEWRAGGPSPVDAAALLEKLLAADADARWARSVGDSLLREALRADGRGEGELGTVYLRAAVEAARRARAIAPGAVNDRSLAQICTVAAERALEAGDLETARAMLAEACSALGRGVPAEGSGPEELAGVAEDLRRELGAARPRFRPGR